MTRMIPPVVHSNVRSGAERRIFKVIERAPGSDAWVCLHSLGLARHITKRRGEIDFLLLSEDGIFVLEVKGGRIKRDMGVWCFTNRYGETFRHPEGPFDQASGAMFSLESDIRKKCDEVYRLRVLFGYGVVMPDVAYKDVGCEADPELVYDIDDRKRGFDQYIRRLVAATRKSQRGDRSGLTAAQIDKLVGVLRPDFDLIPPVASVLDQIGDDLAALTREQYAVLDSIESYPRVLVDGVAGSGKTLLAIESARRRGRAGQSVLMLCYNKLLSEQLSLMVREEDFAGSIEVRTMHAYCRELVNASSLIDEFKMASEGATTKSLFDDIIPVYASMAVLEDVRPKYAAVVVDEGQDLLTGSFLDVLDGSLEGGLEAGQWLWFLDSNVQASVYGRLDVRSLERLQSVGVRHVLTCNCRNTRQIAEHTAIVSGIGRRNVPRVDGPPVEFFTYSPELGWGEKLSLVLCKLADEGVPKGRITVLLARVPKPDDFACLQRLGLRELKAEDVRKLENTSIETVFWTRVSGYKGLESDVIVLVGLNDIESDWGRAIAYVGMSRARSRLLVLVEEKCEPVRMERLERDLRERLEGNQCFE